MLFSSYIICGTPRSGSTLLCDLLASTGVAGRPHSYYRTENASHWAALWGVPQPHHIATAAFETAYLSATIREGTSETGTFGLRLMWGSVADASRRLDAIAGDHADIADRFEKAFGPILYIHLSRKDKLAQAISLIRAEQSGLWHRAVDGTERERTARPQTPYYDADRIADALVELMSGDDAWHAFFAERGIHPLKLNYEVLSENPQSALKDILLALNRDARASELMTIQTAKLADADSLRWAERFRQETGWSA